jgi:phage regulator Rha-like protein
MMSFVLRRDRLEEMLQERDEALAAAREDNDQAAEVVHEWEGYYLMVGRFLNLSCT